jgi:hypothetical protein
LILLSPWIETEQISLVPDPADFNPKFKWDLLKVAKKKRNRKFTSQEKQEMERMQELQKEILFRYIRRLPEDSQRHMLKQSSPGLSPDEVDAFIEFSLRERARDPIAVDRTFTEKDKTKYLTMVRSGAGFDMSLIICRLLGAVPFTPLVIRMNDYVRAKRHHTDRWKPFCELFNKNTFRFLYHVDSALVFRLKEVGYLSKFRQFFTNLSSRLNSDTLISNSEIGELTKELKVTLRHTETEWEEIENIINQLDDNRMIFGFIKGHLVLDIEEEGYASNDVDKLWTTYVDSTGPYQRVRMAFRLVHDEDAHTSFSR